VVCVALATVLAELLVCTADVVLAFLLMRGSTGTLGPERLTEVPVRRTGPYRHTLSTGYLT